MSARTNRQAPQEHPGRKVGATAGGWVDSLLALRKVLLLCFKCNHKLGSLVKRNQYYRDTRFGYASAKCDDCRQHFPRCFVYIPEEYLTAQGGKSRSGHSWIPG